MAWRIDEAVVRGEIDNRVRGRVTGRIWFTGRAEPVELELAGDAWRDVAGRRLEFVNPSPAPGLCAAFASEQKGRVGDITASRKVRVPDIPREEFEAYHRARKPFPWHWGNALYLEWFSERNGRVVIESADFELRIIGEAAWEMTPAEETQQRQANGREMNHFMDLLGEALAEAKVRKATDGDLSDPLVMEAEVEEIEESDDVATDRPAARSTRKDAEAKDDFASTPERSVLHLEWLDGIFWRELTAIEDRAVAMGDIVHLLPLAERGRDLAIRLVDEITDRQWLADDAHADHPLALLANSVVKAATTLMSMLDAEDWPPPLEFCEASILHLSFAHRNLAEADRALATCAKKSLADRDWLENVRRDVADLREETDSTIVDLRVLVERGFE